MSFLVIPKSSKVGKNVGKIGLGSFNLLKFYCYFSVVHANLHIPLFRKVLINIAHIITVLTILKYMQSTKHITLLV